MYGPVDDLRAAYEGAGGDCANWKQDNRVTLAAESGSCDADTVLAIYTSVGDRDSLIDVIRGFADILGMHLLVGPNWIKNSTDVADIRESLGGTLVTKEPASE